MKKFLFITVAIFGLNHLYAQTSPELLFKTLIGENAEYLIYSDTLKTIRFDFPANDIPFIKLKPKQQNKPIYYLIELTDKQPACVAYDAINNILLLNRRYKNHQEELYNHPEIINKYTNDFFHSFTGKTAYQNSDFNSFIQNYRFDDAQNSKIIKKINNKSSKYLCKTIGNIVYVGYDFQSKNGIIQGTLMGYHVFDFMKKNALNCYLAKMAKQHGYDKAFSLNEIEKLLAISDEETIRFVKALTEEYNKQEEKIRKKK